jgi:hypothetical protein
VQLDEREGRDTANNRKLDLFPLFPSARKMWFFFFNLISSASLIIKPTPM